jgi:hypothetical protein
MPSSRWKKNRFRKSLNTSPPGSPSSKSGAANCCVGRATREVRPRREERHAQLGQRPAVHLGEAHLQHHLLALHAAGQLKHVDDG